MKERKECPCKRVHCQRHGDCEPCWDHHHAPGKKMLTTCERLRAKEEKKRAKEEKKEGIKK